MPRKIKSRLAGTMFAGVDEMLQAEEKKRRKELLDGLKHLLDYLNETFAKDIVLRRPEHQHWPLIWPKKDDLEELDQLVYALARCVRKKELTSEDAYVTVGERWPGLGLAQFFDRLRDRIAANHTPKPPESAAFEHVTRIRRLAERETNPSATAKAFLADFRALINGTIPLSKIRWPRYRQLLCNEGTSSIQLENNHIRVYQGDDLLCYAKYLELERGYLRWEREFEQWKQQRPLLDWFERMERRDTELAQARRERQKSNARKRKRNERWRKVVAAIPVTDESPSSRRSLEKLVLNWENA